MQTNYLTYDQDNSQPEGIYWCRTCQRKRHHSFYDSRDGYFYQVASDEEWKEAAEEPDILMCDACVEKVNYELDGEQE